MPEEKLIQNSRSFDKMYGLFCKHIALIKAGKESIIISKHYVVISNKRYEELIKMKPYLNMLDRFAVRHNTLYGAIRMVQFRFLQLCKEVRKCLKFR